MFRFASASTFCFRFYDKNHLLSLEKKYLIYKKEYIILKLTCQHFLQIFKFFEGRHVVLMLRVTFFCYFSMLFCGIDVFCSALFFSKLTDIFSTFLSRLLLQTSFINSFVFSMANLPSFPSG